MGYSSVRRIKKNAVLIPLIATAISGGLYASADQWSSIGPEGGRVVRLLADPRNPLIVYAGTCAGLWKTADGGASWSAVNSGLPTNACIDTVAIDPENTGTVFALASCGVFKTADGGASWSAMNFGLNQSDCIVSLALDPSSPGTLYASGNGGIFKTTDGSSTWIKLTASLPSPNFLLAVDPHYSGTVYAQSFGGLVKSTDGGVNWSLANSGLPMAGAQFLAFDLQTTGTLYAVSWNNKIFKSTDGGDSWADASLGLPPAPAPSAGYSQVFSLAVSPYAPAVLYALIKRSLFNMTPEFLVLTSTDGAASWTTLDNPILSANDLNTISLDPQQPGVWYLGTNSGVLKTTDGGSRWNFANSGLRATSVRQVAIDSRNGTLLAVNATDRRSRGAGLFKSTDGGKSWAPSDFGLPLSISGLTPDPQDPRALYILGFHSSSGTGLFKSQDEGESWSEIWANTSPSTGVWPLAITPQNPNIMYAGVRTCTGNCYSRISRSTDGGRTWVETQASLKGTGCCSSVYSLAIDPQDPETVYAGTSDYNGTGSGLWKSTDGGIGWTNLAIRGDITDIAINPRDTSTIYVAQDFLYKSTDGGQTWNVVNSGLPGCCGIGPLVIDPQNSGTLYCAGWDHASQRARVFRSTDGGASWTPMGSGLAGNIYSLMIDPEDTRTVYAATSGGLFTITFEARQQTTVTARRAR